MQLLGATRRAGRGGHADAEGGDVARRSATGSPTSTTRTTSSAPSVGPAPYPAIVRELQRVDRRRGARAAARARGPAARPRHRLRRRRLERDRHLRGVRRRRAGVELSASRPAGEGLDSGRHGAPLTVGGRAGVLHGSLSAVMQDDEGQITEAHSISAGLDYPGVGPGARVAARHAAARATSRSPTSRRCAPSRPSRAWRASSRRSRPPTRSTTRCEEPSDSTLDLVCLSGRGDKDLAQVARADG